MLQSDTEDQLNRSRQNGRSITKSQGRKEHSTYKKIKKW